MIRTAAVLGWIVAMTMLPTGVSRAEQADAAPADSSDDGWRRTADGWERMSLSRGLMVNARPAYVPARLASLPFPGSAHPVAWAGLQLSLSLLALGAFPSNEE